VQDDLEVLYPFNDHQLIVSNGRPSERFSGPADQPDIEEQHKVEDERESGGYFVDKEQRDQ